MINTYIIVSSGYTEASDKAKELGLEIGDWKWIRDKFKDPLVYKRMEVK